MPQKQLMDIYIISTNQRASNQSNEGMPLVQIRQVGG